MKYKKLIIRLILSVLIGIILGIITELALIFDIKSMVILTQYEEFWLTIMLFVIYYSKNMKEAIISNSLIMIFMSISYYMTRYIYNGGYTNFYAMRNYAIQGCIVGLILSVVLTFPKKGKYLSIINCALLIIYYIYYLLTNIRYVNTQFIFPRKMSINIYFIITICGIIICILQIRKLFNKIKKDKIKTKKIY